MHSYSHSHSHSQSHAHMLTLTRALEHPIPFVSFPLLAATPITTRTLRSAQRTSVSAVSLHPTASACVCAYSVQMKAKRRGEEGGKERERERERRV